MAGAATAEQWYVDYAEDGLVVWTAWYQDSQGETPDEADLQLLMDSEELTHTVLSDPGHQTDLLFDPEGKTRPTWVIIAPGGEVIHTGRVPAEGLVVDALP